MRYLKIKQKIIGILILVSSYAYIVYRLSNININLSLVNINATKGFYILIFIILAFLNILTESVKWKILLSGIINVKLPDCIRMVFAGFSSGIFTPAKIGEPYGRIIPLPRKLWSKGTALNYFGGFLQNIVIFLTGSIFTYFAVNNNNFQYAILLKYTIVLLVVSVTIFYLLFVFRVRISTYISQYRILNSVTKSFGELRYIKPKKYINLFVLSLTRYFTYCTQLILLLYICSDSQFTISTLIIVPIYFMCITVIPSFLLADLGVRNSVALFLFSINFPNETSIILAVSMLWITNQVIPAIIGSYFIIKKDQ
ncbi:lysylphosphatidylglycerol synthase domain-containing protein [Plebeiibacterium sediminum]|uniref:Flippase-like domain-containing protein n=1 Tax=Plebeiibacterium sediminum TaxID=2992112 RepID=A0AAE3SDP3_9BACT|nr:lysylphosphatidylglycerol synthase domain-containing protein [Plebeiobacterium sediminum]MCW3785072.1 flippase-like domain-containing protein [Plebeiobacterium sediminum]